MSIFIYILVKNASNMEILNYLGEIWKDIKGFEGKYQVSNFGRVKSIERLDSIGRTVKERFLKPSFSRGGYLCVGLCFSGKSKLYKVHRLVWEAFKGPIPDGLQINHIDEDKTNNKLENLELVTPKENCNYGTRNERVSKSKINGKKSKPVLQYDLNGNLIKEWPSLMEINRQLEYSIGNIGSCCQNRQHYKTAYGYIWKYKN